MVKVFVPDNKFNHMAYYYYDANKLGQLDFGDIVITSLGIGMIMIGDILDELRQNSFDLFRTLVHKNILLVMKQKSTSITRTFC